MKNALIIGVCVLGLAACGNKTDMHKADPSAPPADKAEPAPVKPSADPAPAAEEMTPEARDTTSTADAFSKACLDLARNEEVDSPVDMCKCAASNLSETMSDEEFAIAAKAITYSNPATAREALADETDNLDGIIIQIGSALEGCD